MVLPLHKRKAEKEKKPGARGEVVQVEYGVGHVFYDVVVLLLEQWMWLGVSAGGQIRSCYISPKGKEGTSPLIE